MKKNALVLAALAGLAASEAQASAKSEAPVGCFGVNTCKGSGKCGVSKDQIDLANKTFHNKFDKTKEAHDCGGHNGCGAKQGFLAWVSEKSADDCHNKGGFTFKKGADGKLTIEQGKAPANGAAPKKG